MSADEIDHRVAGTMHLFQQLVRKKWDLRVTVAGDAVFAIRIESPLLDWRHDYQQTEYRVTRVSDELAGRMRRYLQYFGLASGCFDFAVAADDRPMFLECNPNGQWAWLQVAEELPMATAFADLLAKGRS